MSSPTFLSVADRLGLRHGPLRGAGRRRVGGAAPPRLLPHLLEQKRELRVMTSLTIISNV